MGLGALIAKELATGCPWRLQVGSKEVISITHPVLIWSGTRGSTLGNKSYVQIVNCDGT